MHAASGAPARRMYGCNAPVGLIYSVNPFIIIFLVPVVGALFTRVQHFDMIHYGSYLSALAPFWIVAFPQGAPRSLARHRRARVGSSRCKRVGFVLHIALPGEAAPSCVGVKAALSHRCVISKLRADRLADVPTRLCAEWAVVLFVVTLSLGESVWSPRWCARPGCARCPCRARLRAGGVCFLGCWWRADRVLGGAWLRCRSRGWRTCTACAACLTCRHSPGSALLHGVLARAAHWGGSA
jgi:hypothetical protein